MNVLAAVPVKRFFVAKGRLAPVLSPASRSRLGRALAAHTISTVAAAGAVPLVLAADEEVATWAKNLGFDARLDTVDPTRPPRRGTGLDAAAAGAVTEAEQREMPWLVVHADLPLLTIEDIGNALDVLAAGASVLAPSADGGTSLIASTRAIRFTYGPGSFHRHLARLERPVVLARSGFLLDLDDPTDLAAARSHRRGAWLSEHAGRP